MGTFDKIRSQVIFTTHTPVEAGHDFFSYDLIKQVIDPGFADVLQRRIGGSGLSMTDLALKLKPVCKWSFSQACGGQP